MNERPGLFRSWRDVGRALGWLVLFVAACILGLAMLATGTFYAFMG